MRTAAIALALALSIAGPARQGQRDPSGDRGVRLEELTWLEAEQALRADTVVVLPLGGASVQHGPHLKLRTDAALADHLAGRITAAAPVVIAPSLTFHHYPGFSEYPGSTSLELNTARDLIADAVRSLARSGPRRFYVLNTAYATTPALAAAVQTLAREGILLRYTDLATRFEPVARSIQRQDGGRHADEVETSMMLHIDPTLVDLSMAVRDFGPASTPFALTRRTGAAGTYSPSGTWGDARFATREKGRVLVDALVAAALDDIAAPGRPFRRRSRRPTSPPIRLRSRRAWTAPAHPTGARPATNGPSRRSASRSRPTEPTPMPESWPVSGRRGATWRIPTASSSGPPGPS